MIQLDYGVWLVTRAEWGARPPRSASFLSVAKATSHWEGPHMGTFPHTSCATKVRGIQNYHMDSQGWSDIAYNALACPHGLVFEGRGRQRRSAANGTTAGNSGAYAVCYLGGQGDPLTEEGKRAMKAAGNWLTFPGSTRNNHRDWKPTECPGNVIAAWTSSGQSIVGGQPPPVTPIQEEDVFYVVLDAPPHNVALGGPGYWKHLDGAQHAAVREQLGRGPRSVDQGEYNNLRAACLHGERCPNDAVG